MCVFAGVFLSMDSGLAWCSVVRRYFFVVRAILLHGVVGIEVHCCRGRDEDRSDYSNAIFLIMRILLRHLLYMPRAFDISCGQSRQISNLTCRKTLTFAA